MATSGSKTLEFVAVAKSGVHIYDVTHFMEPKPGQRGHEDWKQNIEDAADWKFEPLVSLPPSSGPAGFCYSTDGKKLVTVETAGGPVASGGPAVVWDATNGYERLFSVDAVGESGGIRAVHFSPATNFLVSHEKYDKEKCLKNVAVWDVRGHPKQVKSHQLRGYSSGKVPLHIYQWTSDDQVCLELCPGTGVLMLDEDMESMDAAIPEPGCGQVSVSPLPAEQASVAVYVPEAGGKAGYVAIYSINDVDKGATVKIDLPTKLNGVEMKWNKDGSAVLILASSDVDPTGQSYFGTTSLFWVQADGQQQQKISGPEDGLCQDFAWAPDGNAFLMIIGSMPAETRLYDGKTGKLVQALGKSRRNTIRWDPFSKYFMVGGFGALPGDLDMFDNINKETLCSFRANIPVESSWAPNGRLFLTCTTCPRMNEDNQVYIYDYVGEQVVFIPFSPKKVRGGPARACDAGAMLYAAAWRPASGFSDPPTSPRGPRRIKGCLPSEGDDKSVKAGTYVAGGADGKGSLTAMMMRGEVPASEGRGGGWGESKGESKGEGKGGGKGFGFEPEERDTRTWEEVEADKKKRQRERKEAVRAAEQEKVEALEGAKKRDRKIEAAEKKLEALKETLKSLDALKDKEWDELTSDDEAQLEKEVDLKAQIQELEEKIKNGDFA